ncbi:MAG TPA: PTS system mannose/fructose/sorbose family transporter subunit IID [Gemmatimonadaceae bacterium]|nr:PTS system mannose/fructose/sorbose family transporter subunit IID [Gemmatimonadaceae bacterium]
MTPPPVLAPPLPLAIRLVIFSRLLAIQGSWNYEILLGNGIGFCVEPALRQLPGGKGGPAYREALARECRYFNAHPYMAAIAVGALARAETDGVDPDRIERFRTACCGPLGSVGDRLVWAAWLPFCSLLALAAFGFGGSPLLVIALFLGIYNAGHLALRVWGLRAGWQHGLRVASALGRPLLRQSPQYVTQVSAVLAGIAIPLAMDRIVGPGRGLFGVVVLGVAVGGWIIVRLHGRAEGWRIALVALAGFVLFSISVSR